MQNSIIKAVTAINTLNENLFAPLDGLIEKLPLGEWLIDAIKDSLHMLPFLFLIFLAIELIEYFFMNKVNKLSHYSKKVGPLAGSLSASFPQCGFSVIASSLYTRKLITKGTLLAVYLSTSDEAIPVILAAPEKIGYVVPLLLTKIAIAIIAGYFIDFIIDRQEAENSTANSDEEIDEGCCKHHISRPRKRDLIYHPIAHTFNVFVFVLIVTIGINYLVVLAGGEEKLGYYLLGNSIFQPIVTAIFGLIPNCAVSVAITLLYLKGALSFGSVIAGLCSGAGLGLLVLFRKNENIKDTMKIVLLLLVTSMFFGILLQAFVH